MPLQLLPHRLTPLQFLLKRLMWLHLLLLALLQSLLTWLQLLLMLLPPLPLLLPSKPVASQKTTFGWFFFWGSKSSRELTTAGGVKRSCIRVMRMWQASAQRKLESLFSSTDR